MNICISHCTRCLVLLSASICTTQSHANPLPIDDNKLLTLAFDGYKAHQAIPAGVPLSYDWARSPRTGAGNNSTGFSAAIGWGQAFYVKDVATEPGLLAVRNFQTYLCTMAPQGPQWQLKQRGAIEGRQFRADFVANANVKPLVLRQENNQTEVSFSLGTAFHFWPKSGRFDLSSSEICGILVLLEAKQIGGEPSSLLIGLGADYWTSKSAPWDNYKTNRDIAIGRLKLLGADWQWFGLTTATGDAIKALTDNGFTDLK